MKILFTLNSGNPGGMERHVRDLVFGLVARGHEIHVWFRSGPISAWYIDAGATVTEVGIKLDIEPVYISKLSKYARSQKIDLIHAH